MPRAVDRIYYKLQYVIEIFTNFNPICVRFDTAKSEI